MDYDKGSQLTVAQLKSYLKHIPDDVKICIGIGDCNAPAHYLLNYDGRQRYEKMRFGDEPMCSGVLSRQRRKHSRGLFIQICSEY